MMTAEPQPEHRWLQRLVGEWKAEGEATMAPDQPPTKYESTETVRSIGGIWMQCEGRSDGPDGSAAIMIMTLGFDPARKRFVGTFIGSMMTHMWVYDGTLNGDVLTLDTEGPHPSEAGKYSKYQDVIEFKSDDHRILTSRALGDDGQWRHFMTAHYRRVK